MVVFTNGVSARSEYRKFKLSRERNDDTANMFEVVARRFSQKNQKSWGMPDVVLVDGGAPQLDAALRAAEEQGVRVPVVAIAKRNDELVVHVHRSNVVVSFVDTPDSAVGLTRHGDYLYINLHPGAVKSSGHARNLHSAGTVSRYDDVVKLVQRIRDESHRFAISYHQIIRKNRQHTSALDALPGIGPKTRALLLKKFGSVKGLTVASEGEIAAVVGPAKAHLIVRALREPVRE
jgi:excinuclease ABC subunit C